jgi:uncharacterized damage-inducible protein DinB
MKDAVLQAANVNTNYAKQLVADIPDERMAEQPVPGMNHAAWVLGHLTFVADSMVRVFDQPFSMPKEWVELFNLSSKPEGDRSKYPSKAALLEAYDKAYARLAEAVKAATEEALAREFPNPKLRTQLPTVGVAMVHILCSHHGVHLGQLSAWRRTLGLPRAPLA